MKCAICEYKKCTQGQDCLEVRSFIGDDYYSDSEDKRLHAAATAIEARGYLRWNRLQEIIQFCKLAKMSHLGIAFCIGFEQEARVLHHILKSNGFKVSSVCCKFSGTAKEELGLEKIDHSRYEAICNPIGQARLLNKEGTELNIILGLCIGHDILFTKHSKAPVTTLVVKDRVLAHNPVAALYCQYIRRQLIP